MMDEPPIDTRELAARIFAKQQGQERPGHTPTGIIVTAREAAAAGYMEANRQTFPEPEEIAMFKRTAKSVAEKLTGKPCRCFERRDGRVEIEVNGRTRYVGRTWFLALLELKNSIDA